MARKGNAPKDNIQAHRLFDRKRIIFSRPLILRLMLIIDSAGLISTFFSALEIQKFNVEYIGGFGLMRQQVGHAVD